MRARIVYLHGFASSPSSSKATYFARELKRRGARIEVPDLAGGDFEHLTITGQLCVIDQIAAHEPVHLIGSSMGGYLAALYAARHPEVLRLVLLAPAFGFPRRWSERLGLQSMEDWRRNGTVEVFHYAEGRQRKLDYGLIEDAVAYEDYPEFRQPALIFHGTQDDVVPLRYSEEFAALRPNVRLEPVDSGHDLHNVMERIAAESARFLGFPE